MKFEIKLPPEFISGNEIPVSVATIKRERLEEILREAVEADRQQHEEYEFKECRHCGFECKPPSKVDKWYPLPRKSIGSQEPDSKCSRCGHFGHSGKMCGGRATLQQEVSDKGPWQVGRNKSDGRIFIQSEDFEYDVRLYIDGNFGCDVLKTVYAENVCQKLNIKENK